MDELSKNKLSKLRTQIDDVDNQLLALFAKRAELVEEVGKVKKASSITGNFIRSGREAKMMREILAKGAGSFPKPALFSIWRSIIAASLKMEGGLSIAMPRSKSFNMHNLISEYFGTFSDYIICDSVEGCLDQIDAHTIGVLNAHDNWWTLNLKDLRVFAKLHDEIFALAKLTPEETGEDKTLFVSKHEIVELPHIATLNGYYLYEIEGYFTDEKDLNYKDVKILGS
ncbi:MAG: hypothetical protein COV36_01640, partial [Alphaproteobacteria bacterium CG11_big_fil_rev_8_21_14_0_20_44_7]